MKDRNKLWSLGLATVLLMAGGCTPKASEETTAVEGPHLEKRGGVTQLIVEGKPWLALGCELGNSTSSSRKYLAPYWEKLKDSGVNTVPDSGWGAIVFGDREDGNQGRPRGAGTRPKVALDLSKVFRTYPKSLDGLPTGCGLFLDSALLSLAFLSL